jgi:hypothetical protein
VSWTKKDVPQNCGILAFKKNCFKKNVKLAVAANFQQSPENSKPKQTFDQKKHKSGYSKSAKPRFPIFFFHVQ